MHAKFDYRSSKADNLGNEEFLFCEKWTSERQDGKEKNLTNVEDNARVGIWYDSEHYKERFHETLDENGGQDGKGSAAC